MIFDRTYVFEAHTFYGEMFFASGSTQYFVYILQQVILIAM